MAGCGPRSATQATFHPTRGWTDGAAACVVGQIEKAGLPIPAIILRDNDRKFGGGFDDELAGEGIRTERLPVQNPLFNLNLVRQTQLLQCEYWDQYIPV